MIRIIRAILSAMLLFILRIFGEQDVWDDAPDDLLDKNGSQSKM
jgi:hypothetical protein